jgi:NADPH-dependent glutamate synthase beta subunit-like oxidoreductase
VKAALDEGIKFHFLANPVKVLGEGYVTGLVIQRQRLGEFDAGGRRRPIPIDGDEFTLDIDMVIPAIGQTTDTSWMQDTGISATRSSTFVVNEALATTRPGVFAAGDAVSGPATVVEAVAQGNQVAVAVDHWLKTGEYAKPRYETSRPDIVQLYNLDEYANARRPHVPELALDERYGTFGEVELGFDERTVREEAKRCLRCDLEWLDYMKLPRPVGDAEPVQG